MTWFIDHIDLVATLAGNHALLAGLPVLLGLLIALPLGWFAARTPRAYTILVAAAGLLYTIPSLALFVLLPLVLGTRILDPINVIVAMTIYTVALLVRTVADGLIAVPPDVTASATAMGMRPLRRFATVELPLAVPVIGAGMRVAAVSNVSIVSVASLIGASQLGDLLIDGFNRYFNAPLITGILACVALALLFDGAILVTTRVLSPWTRTVATP